MAKLTPYPFQVEDQETLHRNGYTGLVGIEAGGGKSLTATLAIRDAKPSTTLILAPQSTHKTAWIPTLADNADVEARIIGNSNKAQRQALFDFELGAPGVYLASPQFVTRADTSAWSGDMIIHDEAHQGSTAKSKLQRKLGGYHASDGHPLAHRFDARLALSGTPMRQDFANLWGIMRFLYGDTLDRRGEIASSNFVQWQLDRMSYEEVYTSQRTWDGKPKVVKKFLTESEPGRLLSEIPAVILHKRRETCCKWHEGGFLPTEEPQVIERTVELSPKQKKAVREMETLMMTYLEGHPLEAEIPLTQKQRIRQLTLGEAEVETYEGVNKDGESIEKTRIRFNPEAPSPFLDETLHILSNLPADENVVVFLESQQYAEVLTHRLTQEGYTAAEYSGVRKADLASFGRDYRVLVGVIAAIGTGTAGLNHLSHTEILFEQPISLTMREQVTARLDRLDNKQRVQRYVLLDDLGVQSGRAEDLLLKKIMVARSMARR
jgi:hypothetical protein